jgi:isopentenyl diphosphate isomerase/L-lactate dehydrogenase-like FMN-dependent dehydrogenase
LVSGEDAKRITAKEVGRESEAAAANGTNWIVVVVENVLSKSRRGGPLWNETVGNTAAIINIL